MRVAESPPHLLTPIPASESRSVLHTSGSGLLRNTLLNILFVKVPSVLRENKNKFRLTKSSTTIQPFKKEKYLKYFRTIALSKEKSSFAELGSGGSEHS